MHEEKPRAGDFCGELLDIATQHGRQIGIDNGGGCTRHETQERAYFVTHRYTLEARLTCKLSELALMRGKLPGMDQCNRAGLDPRGARASESGERRRRINLFDLDPLRRDPTGGLEDLRVKLPRQANIEIEEPRPCLRADPKQIREAAVHDQESPRPLALKKRVGRNRGAHFDDIDDAARNSLVWRHTQSKFDSSERGIAIARGILTQELVRRERAIGRDRHDIRERAAAVNPELPTHLPAPMHNLIALD